ncbi:glutathione S-transferase [Roseovarius sp. LXJ103]|uniref:glutathione S-transferase n=1 Tax=Roseovarius carneus TaxID=2853164 RepID=UPI000D61058A|nr:glutathione S-transferase [Roseovarius carneus]MBZ8117511.1 glutathione S-transferase [Roseovarius carneus]PWE36692.1 glutathione S-transferase [Pelagicola sp. LXJ1103]
MKLLTAAPSPFGRKVMALLHETGQLETVEVQMVAASPVATPADLAATNPVGKIPALIREGGPALYDSRVICRYLDAQVGGVLYPEARIWETLTLEATADGIMDAAILMVYEGRVRPEELHYDVWIEAQWTKVERSLDALEARWMSHLAGPLDMGQIAVACALGYLDFRHVEREWRGVRPQLAAWHGVFSKRASMEATRPE